MEVDEEDALLFLREVFKKESDPGSLTMRMLRERYCTDRGICHAFAKAQRQTFAKIVDALFNEFADAQEAARAMKLPMPRTVVAKRPCIQSTSDDDFQPTKRPKKPPEVRIELSEEDFQPIKPFKKPPDPSHATENAANRHNSQSSHDRTDAVVRAMVKDLYKTQIPKNAKVSSDKVDAGMNNASTDKERLQLKYKLELDLSTSSSPENSPKKVEGKNYAKETGKSSDKDSIVKSKKNGKLKSKSSSANESPISASSDNQPESSNDEQVSSEEVSQSQDDKNSSSGDIKLSLQDHLSSDDEYQHKVTAAKKNTKIVSNAEECKHNGIGSDGGPLAKISKLNGKKDRKKLRNKHKTVKKVKYATKKHSKSVKIKAEGTNRDGFSSTDEEPQSGFQKTEANANEKFGKTLSKDWEEGNSSVGNADEAMQESDSDAFKKKTKTGAKSVKIPENGDHDVKKSEKAIKMSNTVDKELNESKKEKPLVNEDTDPALIRLKRYLHKAGIRVIYVKIFKDCKSIGEKKKMLSSILADAGIKGKPSIDKCRKLRKKRETMAEVGELDPSNILGSTEGRTRRTMRNVSASPPSPPASKHEKQDDSSAKKVFKRLKGIVDSEDSDSG